MTTKEAIAKAAELFAEWKDGDTFESHLKTGSFSNCETVFAVESWDVLSRLIDSYEVRIKPRPKKVLRPAWEILREAEIAGRVGIGDGRDIIIDKVYLADVIRKTWNGSGYYDFPDWFFTTKEPNR